MALVRHRQEGVLQVSGSFSGASTPVIGAGKGFTVARSGTGEYTITLLQPAPAGTKLVVTGLSVSRAAADADITTGTAFVQVKGAPVAATGVIILRTATLAGAWANAADTTVIGFQAELRTSTEVV